MASSISNGKADLRWHRRSFVAVAGWEALHYEACGWVTGCECCREMAVGCLCERSTRRYEFGVARRMFEKAKERYAEWLREERALRGATNHEKLRRTRTQTRRNHEWLKQRNIEAERARAVALLDAERYKEYATVDEALDDGVFGYTPKKSC